MVENSGFEFELSENELRNQFNMAFQKERVAIRTLLSLIHLDTDDFVNQGKLNRAVYDINEFDLFFRNASVDDFRAIAANPRVPME